MNQNNYDEEEPKQIIIKSQIKDNLLLNYQKNQTNLNEIEQDEEIVKRKGKKKRNKKGKKPCNYKESTDKKIDVESNNMKNEIQKEEEKNLDKNLVIEEDKKDNNYILIKGKKLRNIDNNISYDEFYKNTIEINWKMLGGRK